MVCQRSERPARSKVAKAAMFVVTLVTAFTLIGSTAALAAPGLVTEAAPPSEAAAAAQTSNGLQTGSYSYVSSNPISVAWGCDEIVVSSDRTVRKVVAKFDDGSRGVAYPNSRNFTISRDNNPNIDDIWKLWFKTRKNRRWVWAAEVRPQPDPCETSEPDTDGDGVPDASDNCVDDINPSQADGNNNGLGDACDDRDGDDVVDLFDNCVEDANSGQADLDGDGQGDVCDDDDDDDGVPDASDNCDGISNPNQADLDNDGIGNDCDDDLDGDGVLNTADNCTLTANPGQIDNDNDDVGDVCTPNACNVQVFGFRDFISGTEPGVSGQVFYSDIQYPEAGCNFYSDGLASGELVYAVSYRIGGVEGDVFTLPLAASGQSLSFDIPTSECTPNETISILPTIRVSNYDANRTPEFVYPTATFASPGFAISVQCDANGIGTYTLF